MQRSGQPPESGVAPGDPARVRGEDAESQPPGRRGVGMAGRQPVPLRGRVGKAGGRRGQGEPVGEAVGRREVGPAEPAGDELAARGGRTRRRRAVRVLLGRYVARVVVPVAGQPQPDPGPRRDGRGTGHLLALPDDPAIEPVHRVELVGLLLVGVHPGRRGGADDHTVTGPQPGGQVLPEEQPLRLVDVGAELGVQPDQPPALGQLDDEVAARLAGAPPADLPALAEQPHERGQPVVPVVVARQRDQQRRVVGHWEGGAVGPAQPVLVLGRGGGGIDLVAAEHQPRPPEQRVGVPGQPELGSGEQPGHRVGGVEPVTQVGDEVQPAPAVGVRPDREQAGVERALQFPLVEVVGEDRGQRDLDRGPPQFARGQPAHLLAGDEPERGCVRHQLVPPHGRITTNRT